MIQLMGNINGGTVADKVLRNKAFNIAKSTSIMMDINVDMLQWSIIV